jgi:hypothetical protein
MWKPGSVRDSLPPGTKRKKNQKPQKNEKKKNQTEAGRRSRGRSRQNRKGPADHSIIKAEKNGQGQNRESAKQKKLKAKYRPMPDQQRSAMGQKEVGGLSKAKNPGVEQRPAPKQTKQPSIRQKKVGDFPMSTTRECNKGQRQSKQRP